MQVSEYNYHQKILIFASIESIEDDQFTLICGNPGIIIGFDDRDARTCDL